MAAPLALPDAFWDQLARSHWERAPLVFRAPGGRALATLDEVFAGLVAAADRYRQLDGGVRLRLFLDGALAQHDIVSLLPAREDGSIAGYAARLDRALDGREYLLVINNLQRHLPGLHRRLCGFLAPLYRRVGMPAGLADADVFVGRYSRTPFGVHKDDASNFQFILEGDKTMRVWPDQAFGDPAAMWEDASHVRDAEYERARARGEVLRGRPGDVLYWPSSHWHVGESDRRLSVALNLALYLPEQPLALALRALEALAGARAGPDCGEERSYPFDPDRLPATAAAIPPAIARAAALVREAAAGPDLEVTLAQMWAERVTGYGFLTATGGGVAGVDLATATAVGLARDRELVCVALGARALVVAEGGRSETFQGEPEKIAALRELFARVAAHGRLPLAELVHSCAPLSRGEINDALDTLRAWGALRCE